MFEKLFTAGLVKSVGEIVDDVVTTKEEKMAIGLENTKDARNMNIEVQRSENSTKLAKNISPLLAIAATVLTFALFYVVIFTDVDDKKKDIVIYILGALSAIITQIFSFYFGSSLGSSEKNKMLGKL